MRDSTKKTLIVICLIIVSALVMSLIILTTLHVGQKSERYDFDCLTKPIAKPLSACDIM